MAAYVHFFKMSPADYWALDNDELAALDRYMKKWADAKKQQQQRRG